MNLPQILYAIRWLIWDTFRQSLATGIFRGLLFFDVIIILACLSITAEGPERDDPNKKQEYLPGQDIEVKQRGGKLKDSDPIVAEGIMTLGLGAFRVQFPGFRTEAVRHIHMYLAWGIADSMGVILALVFTAGFLPTFLEPAAATVLLTKPVPRWALLLGKYLGVLALVFLHALVFVGGTWLALGTRTGVWHAAYLLCIPLLLVQFAVFFSTSVLLAVTTRSTVACVFGSILFWLICWGINYGRDLVVTAPELQLNGFLRGSAEVAYWALPKPIDFGLLLFNGLGAGEFKGHPWSGTGLESSGAYLPELSVLSSLLFGIVMLGMAGWELSHADY